jgi:hypothetical protein
MKAFSFLFREDGDELTGAFDTGAANGRAEFISTIADVTR